MQKGYKLKIAIAQALGITALAGLSMDASAVSYWTDMGAVATPASTITLTNADAAKRSWSDYGAGVNRGWTHFASFFTFQVGSSADIAAGTRFNVTIDALGTAVGSQAAMANPAFSVWTSGSTPTNQPFSSQAGYGHHWSQVRGSFDGGVGDGACSIDCNLGVNGWFSSDFTANGAGNPGNIVSGHDGWIGYANSGYSFKNGEGDYIQGRLAGASNPTNKGEYGNGGAGSVGGPAAGTSFGNVNTSSPWVQGGNATLAAGDATLALLGLKAGYYMIGLGGVCPDNNQNGQNCASAPPGGKGVQLTINNLGVTAVPLPSAVWLFGGALMGYLGTQRKKSAMIV